MMTGRKNSLSIEEHVALILEADTDIKNGVLLKADRVLSAIEQLGDKHSKELAAKIGMTGASLSKWRGIAESKIIKTNRSGVPYSMTALYMMTLLGKPMRITLVSVRAILACRNSSTPASLVHLREVRSLMRY
jgi:hypothetical protein